jgi:hypothetical protein
MKKAVRIKFSRHPELRDNEAVIINLPTAQAMGLKNNVSDFRIGETAYDKEGNIIPDYKPVFGKIIKMAMAKRPVFEEIMLCKN